MCLGAFRTSPVESLQAEANEPPLALRRNKLALQFASKVYCNSSNPASSSIFEPQYELLFQRKQNAIPPLSIRIQPYLRDMNIDTTSFAMQSFLSTPPWLMLHPDVMLHLHVGKKSEVNPDTFKIHYFELLSEFHDFTFIYTDGSKDGNTVGCAAICGATEILCRLPDYSSIFSAEIRAILLALDLFQYFDSSNCIIFSDSLSSLQAIKTCKYDNVLVQQVAEKCHMLCANGKTVKFCWLPSHIGIKGNERADAAAKSALKLPVLDFKIPYSDVKTRIAAHFKHVFFFFSLFIITSRAVT